MDDLVRAYERFQQAGRHAEDRIARYAGMRERIEGIESVAHSPDHCVTVVAGPGGAVKDIRFNQEALRQGPRALRGSVMSTLRSAVAGAVRQQAAVVQEFVGDDMNVLDQVLRTQADMLGTSVESLRQDGGAGGRGSRSRSASADPLDDEDDFGIWDDGRGA